jgi:hypothetical protein
MNKDIRVGLIWAAIILALALGATVLRQQGTIDQDTVLRVVIGINGLMIAYYGNRAPKVVAPSVFAQHLARFSGWSMVLSGIVYAGVWAFAPIQTAVFVGCGAVILGIIATIGYSVVLRGRARRA